MAVFQEKWKKLKESFKARGVFMFNNDLLSDISLVVRSSSGKAEPKKTKMAIPAHKVVLSICSPVFFAMFCGEMAERSSVIDLPDCDYEGVLEMLRFMYSEEAKIDENNVLQVLYVAKKYMVDFLANQCVFFLRKYLNPSNVFTILPHAQKHTEKVLVDQCWEVIDRETEKSVKSEGFLTIEWFLLLAVVKRDTLTIKEVELFKAVDLWARKECVRLGVTVTPAEKRCIVGEPIMKEIRFPAMDQKDFASVVLDSEMLTRHEVVTIVNYFNSVLKSPTGFHSDKRIGAYQSCFRYRSIGSYWTNSSAEPIDFSSDKDVVLHGVSLFGRENGTFEVTLTMVEDDDGVRKVIVDKSGKFSSVLVHKKEFSYYGYNVMFDPVNLRKECKYSALVKIKGGQSCFGANGARQITSRGVTFSFNLTNSTPPNQNGQFADFIFKLP